MKVSCKNDKRCKKIGTNWGNYKIMASYEIVPIQCRRVASSLRYVRLIISFNTMCTGKDLFVINDKRWKNMSNLGLLRDSNPQ